jgi:flagellar FliJ protein
MARPPKKSKRFKYNLESALNFRELKEDEAQDKFNKAKQKYKQELEKENQLKHQEQLEHSGLINQLSEGKTIDFQQVMMRKAHLEQLKVKIIEQVENRKLAESEKKKKHTHLVQAMKDRKILEEDREKKKENWKKVMKKEEMKFLDEIASIAFSKQLQLAKEESNQKEKKKLKNHSKKFE